jgi:transcription-repair coupling factor (superfamily II helicase)
MKCFHQELHLLEENNFLPLFYDNLETLFDYCKNSQILIHNDIIELFDERTENLKDYFEARNDSKDSFFLKAASFIYR